MAIEAGVVSERLCPAARGAATGANERGALRRPVPTRSREGKGDRRGL
jgi:hypothetical protein